MVISLHPESRKGWLTTQDMDDDDLDEYEHRTIREDERREWAVRNAAEAAFWARAEATEAEGVRYDYSGYPIPD